LDPGGSQFNVPAVSDKELAPELALKIAYLIRERRSGNVKSLCRPTEMQLLGDGYEVSELPKLHAIDASAAVPTVALIFRSSPGLPHLGSKSWTRDDERALLQRVIFVPTEQTAKVEVSTQQQQASVQSAPSTRT
jgi:hypothetical protein